VERAESTPVPDTINTIFAKKTPPSAMLEFPPGVNFRSARAARFDNNGYKAASRN
jgi:hypothetical protein